MTVGLQKAHEAVRPARAANKGALASLESPEERASTKGNPDCQSTRRTQCRARVPQAAGRIGKAAQRNPKERLTALFHHLTPEGPGATYLALKKDVAAGVDDMTCEKYGEGLDERLLDLHQRLHRGGACCAPPLRRLEIAEPDGGTRQLGMAALEDKIDQQAVVDVILTPIYEGEFWFQLRVSNGPMAEHRRHGGWIMERYGHGHAAGGIRFPRPGEHVPALRARSVVSRGTPPERSGWRSDHRAWSERCQSSDGITRTHFQVGVE